MKTLKEFAQEQRISYRTAWNYFKAGKIPLARKNEFGELLIGEDQQQQIPDYVICYARVSSSENKSNLDNQADRWVDYCATKGYQVKAIVKECASGLNDKRPKLLKVLTHEEVTRIVIEHHDRLTRFGFNYLKEWMQLKGCEIEVIHPVVDDKEDLMKDFVSLITSFTARLYGLRRSQRKTEQLIKALKNEN